jgi:hypothetical protein
MLLIKNSEFLLVRTVDIFSFSLYCTKVRSQKLPFAALRTIYGLKKSLGPLKIFCKMPHFVVCLQKNNVTGFLIVKNLYEKVEFAYLSLLTLLYL